MANDPAQAQAGRFATRLAALAVVTGLGAALIFGYLGRLHPALDSFSHLRLHLSGLLLVLVPILVALRFRAEALFSLALGLAAPIQTVALPPAAGTPQAAAEGAATYRLLHLNLRYDNPTPEAVLSLIGRSRPDVVTLAEVAEPWTGRLGLIEAAYPYRLICERPTFIGGVAILSRRPFSRGTEPRCGNRGAFVHASIDFGGRDVEVAALHMGWPWPFEQPWQLGLLEPLLREIGPTAIVTGDFNAVPWSHAARRVAAAADARIVHGIGPTWLDRRLPAPLTRWIGLPIDNVMTKGRIAPARLATLEAVGSDHLPVLMEFTVLPRDEPPAEVMQVRIANERKDTPRATPYALFPIRYSLFAHIFG